MHVSAFNWETVHSHVKISIFYCFKSLIIQLNSKNNSDLDDKSHSESE